FFFQAEDGIRDRNVTGVQTCALPISRVRSIEVHSQAADRAVPGRRTALALVGVDKSELARGHVVVTGAGWRATTMLDAAVELLRSEERRVGKESRSRWGEDDEKDSCR